MNSILWDMFRLEMLQCSNKIIVHGKGNLEDIESVSINMFERVLLVLDKFFEGADRLSASDFDRKDLAGIVTKHNTVDVEVA
jgi:hypothetical protein